MANSIRCRKTGGGGRKIAFVAISTKRETKETTTRLLLCLHAADLSQLPSGKDVTAAKHFLFLFLFRLLSDNNYTYCTYSTWL